jgi:acyl-CoA reductase-like NAD-dependent aldehyde dehydrogenase
VSDVTSTSKKAAAGAAALAAADAAIRARAAAEGAAWRPKSNVSVNRIPCTDPATGEALGDAVAYTPAEIRGRILRAKKVQLEWAKTSFGERRRVLRRLLDYIVVHADELSDVIARDAGKTRENAMLGEIWPVCEKLRHTIASGERDLRVEHVSSGLMLHKAARIEYRPLGVIGVICPWNFPLQNVMGPTIPALMAGNAVIVKVSEWVAWSAPRFQAIFDQVLGECGFPKDLVQVVNGYADAGAALVSGGVDKIVFTGSMANGKKVASEAAKTLTPIILELGGKDAMIVCDDADLEQAAHAAVAGAFIASGQMCLAAERVYVFESVHDAFVDKVVSIAKQLRQGPPLEGKLVDVGAMTMPAQVDVVEGLVNDAVAKGARAIVGGKRGAGPGQFFQPTVLVGVDDTMNVTREECFGPILSIHRVRDEEEAVERANDSDYGLGSTVFTKDGARGDRMAAQIVAGSTVVNDFGLGYMANALPFGGVRGSGYGRLNGRVGIRELCNVKAVMVDRFPGFSIPTKVFPMAENTFRRARATIELLYGGSIGRRWSGLVSLLKRNAKH